MKASSFPVTLHLSLKDMSEEQQPKEQKNDGGGRVVYSRLPSEEEPRAEVRAASAGSLQSLVREPLAPALPTLLVAFLLLVLLVFGLG